MLRATLGPSWKSLKRGESHMQIPFHREAGMSWEVQWPWQVGLAHFLVFLLCASPHLKNSAPCIFWMHLPSWSRTLCLVHAQHLCVEQTNERELLAKMLNNLTWMALHLIHNHMIYIYKVCITLYTKLPLETSFKPQYYLNQLWTLNMYFL